MYDKQSRNNSDILNELIFVKKKKLKQEKKT